MLAGTKKKKTTKKKEPAEEILEEEEVDQKHILLDMDALNALDNAPKIRTTGLYGSINEEKCAEVITSLIYLRETGKREVLKDPKDIESEIITVCDPIEFFISSYGGGAADMFAVYDMIRSLKKQDFDIITVGLGKVMSAGVLLLASGTDGKRKIGANCRVMIHGVISGQHGNLHDLENEMEESRFTQRQYIKALAKETNMTEKYIKKLMDKKLNVYLNAEEAVDLGIADLII